MSQTMREALQALFRDAMDWGRSYGQRLNLTDMILDDVSWGYAEKAVALLSAPSSEQGDEPATINGEAPNAHNLLAALVDIYDDGQKNPPEHRCYVPEAWGEILAEARAFLAASPQPPSTGTDRYWTQPGESLMGIALRQLKDENRWTEIRDLNANSFPDMGPHDYYPVGTALRMPSTGTEKKE